VPVDDFALERIDLDGHDGSVDSNSEQPRIALCVSGEVGIHSFSGDAVGLRPGQAAFVAGTRFKTIFEGTGEVFLATVSARMEI
jgi:mannose-6-phosphate isomerase class I